MTEVVSIKFKSRGKLYYFDPAGVEVQTGESVVVETSKGLEIGKCARGNHNVNEERIIPPLRPVIRVATCEDLRVMEGNRAKETEAFDICRRKIAEHKLEMKLVDVEYNFEGNKILFFFTSDGRVDFRELVKDLAMIFRTRIELRQIGVRDEAKMIGGLGICGRQFCCKQFLNDFQPVSTKMAKSQSMSLNPTKISGSCGRLMCCLRYEQEAYEELLSRMPKNGAFVETPEGFGNVSQINLLRQKVKVSIDGENEAVQRVYDVGEIVVVPGGRPKNGEMPVPTIKPAVRFKPREKEPENISAAISGTGHPRQISGNVEKVSAAPDTEGSVLKKNVRRRQRGLGRQPGETPEPHNQALQEGQKTGQKKGAKAPKINMQRPAIKKVEESAPAPVSEKKKDNYRRHGRRYNKPKDQSGAE